MKLRLCSQTLAQHYIKPWRRGRKRKSGYLDKESHNTTIKSAGEEEHEIQVIFTKIRTTTLKPECEEQHETQVIFTNTRTTLH